jgi:hypothetical protein
MCWLIRNHHYNFIRKSYKILCCKMQNASSQNAKCFVAECKMLRRRMQNASLQNAKYFVTECKILRHRMQNTSSQNGTASATMTTHHIIVQVATMDERPPWTSGRHGRVAAMDEWPPWTSGCHGRVAAMDE